jgi:hypothetical protein
VKSYIVVYWDISTAPHTMNTYTCMAVSPTSAAEQFVDTYPTQELAWVKQTSNVDVAVREYFQFLYL